MALSEHARCQLGTLIIANSYSKGERHLGVSSRVNSINVHLRSRLLVSERRERHTLNAHDSGNPRQGLVRCSVASN